jgi:hypothetical protein
MFTSQLSSSKTPRPKPAAQNGSIEKQFHDAVKAFLARCSASTLEVGVGFGVELFVGV